MNSILEEIFVLKELLNKNDHEKMVKNLALIIDYCAREVIDFSCESKLKNALKEVEDNVDDCAIILIEEWLPSNFNQEEMQRVYEIRDAAIELAYQYCKDEIECHLEDLSRDQ